MKPKIKAILTAIGICSLATTSQKFTQEVSNKGKIYVGIGYAAAQSGNVSNKQAAGIGVWGVVHGAIDGAVYGAVFGGGVGAVVGVAIGL